MIYIFLTLSSLLLHATITTAKVEDILAGRERNLEFKLSGGEGDLDFDLSRGHDLELEFDHSGGEDNPQFDHSGGEDNPYFDHSGVEDNPQFDYSGVEDNPQFDHSGAEDSPRFGHSESDGDPQLVHSGAEHKAKFDREEEEHNEAFSKLPPDELFRLGKIFHKADALILTDGYVTEDELTKWIQYTKKYSNHFDANKQFKKYDVDRDGFVTWDEYENAFWNENDRDKYYHAVLLGYDKKRFKLADQERDMKLNMEEFSAFLYPEDNEVMIADMVRETIDNIDRDNDGLISLQEYLDDLQTGESGEPAWMKSEREQFSELRDKNKDGQMDKEEVREWIIPHDYITTEVKHLISESDADGDGKLSEEEMMEKYNLFLGSRVTDFVDNKHDEL